MECDAVVIGAGIEGSAAAYELAKRSTGRVMLLEQVFLHSLAEKKRFKHALI